MSLNQLILSVMLALIPSQLRPAEESERMVTFKAIAQGINEAVEAPMTELPFDGPAAKEASAIALASISFNESGYRQEVRDCRVKGDGGRSISVFQLINGPARSTFSEKEICSNDTLAAKLSLNVLTWYRYTGSAKSIFRGYATGSHLKDSQGAKNQNDYFTWALVRTKIRLTRKPGVSKLWAVSTESVIPSANDGTIQDRTSTLSP